MILSDFKRLRMAASVLVAMAAGGGASAQETKPANPLILRRSPTSGGQQGDNLVVTAAEVRDITVIQRYSCRIDAWKHAEIRASQSGLVGDFKVKEGQSVKKGDLLFEVEPLVKPDKTSQDAGSTNPRAPLARVVAPFDGIVNDVIRSRRAQVDEGDILMSVTDISVMWAYFSVPEKRYLDYMAAKAEGQAKPKIELELGDGSKFTHPGKIGAILASFDNPTGGVRFRADFANPEGRLRHGQTGTVLMWETHRNATVIPRRSVYVIEKDQYVYVVDKDDVVHRREIVVATETDDFCLIKKGIRAGERILLDGGQPVFLDWKIKSSFRPLEAVISKPKDQK